MNNIKIVSSSIRTGRASHRVALFFRDFINENKLGNATIYDLLEEDLPLFHERIKFSPEPSEKLKKLSKTIAGADGVIIVSPEYNGGYPASLKNMIDVLYDEWYRKPVALVGVSSGGFGGTQVTVQLTDILSKMKALLVPARYQVAGVAQNYNEDGSPTDVEKTNKLAKAFLDELFWCIERTIK